MVGWEQKILPSFQCSGIWTSPVKSTIQTLTVELIKSLRQARSQVQLNRAIRASAVDPTRPPPNPHSLPCHCPSVSIHTGGLMVQLNVERVSNTVIQYWWSFRTLITKSWRRIHSNHSNLSEQRLKRWLQWSQIMVPIKVLCMFFYCEEPWREPSRHEKRVQR